MNWNNTSCTFMNKDTNTYTTDKNIRFSIIFMNIWMNIHWSLFHFSIYISQFIAVHVPLKLLFHLRKWTPLVKICIQIILNLHLNKKILADFSPKVSLLQFYLVILERWMHGYKDACFIHWKRTFNSVCMLNSTKQLIDNFSNLFI